MLLNILRELEPQLGRIAIVSDLACSKEML